MNKEEFWDSLSRCHHRNKGEFLQSFVVSFFTDKPEVRDRTIFVPSFQCHDCGAVETYYEVIEHFPNEEELLNYYRETKNSYYASRKTDE